MAIISLPELPERKFNSPLGRWVCWNCKSGKELINLRDEKGKKTGVYTCPEHKHLGRPTEGESSYIEFKYKE